MKKIKTNNNKLFIQNAVAKLIFDLTSIPPEQIKRNDELGNLGIDSITMVELLITLEDVFSIIFQESDLDPNKLVTVDSIIELVAKYYE